MKTPREIILERHQSAEAKLKLIRAEDLAACMHAAEVPASVPPRPAFSVWRIAQDFWAESIYPWRRVWVGMAAVWLGILVVNVAPSSTPHLAMRKSYKPDSPIVMAALREQKQMFAQLLGPALPAASAPPKIPGPRSDLRVELLVA